MCGIGGIRRFGAEPIVEEQITALLLELEKRGNDATGIALAQESDIQVHKSNVPAWEFTASQDYKDFLRQHLTPETDTVLCHTRFATQGSPRVNDNNHPVYAGLSAVIHNGSISNDDQLFRELKLRREAEVDSDILRAIMDEEGFETKALRSLNKVRGAVAMASVHPNYPGKLLLARSESPLWVAASREQLFWASTKEALHLVTRRWENRFGLWMRHNRVDLTFVPLANHTALLFGPQGKEWRQEFKTAMFTRYEPKYAVNDNYHSRQAKWDHTPSNNQSAKTEKIRFVLCPNPDCVTPKGKRTIMELLPAQQDKPLWNFKCRSCNTLLAPKVS